MIPPAVFVPARTLTDGPVKGNGFGRRGEQNPVFTPTVKPV